MEINEDNLLKAKHSVNIVDRRIRWMNERFVSEEIFLDKAFRTRIMFSVEVRHWRKSGIPRLRKRRPVWFSFIASRHLTPSLSIAFSALVRKSGSGKAVFNVVGFLEKKFKGEWRICFAGKAEKYNFNYDRFLLPDGD